MVCLLNIDMPDVGHLHRIVGIKIEIDEVRFAHPSAIIEIGVALAETEIVNPSEAHTIEDHAIELIEEAVRREGIVCQAQNRSKENHRI